MTRNQQYSGQSPVLLPADHPLTRTVGLILFATLALAMVVPHVLGAGYFITSALAMVWLTRNSAWRNGGLDPLERAFLWSVAIFVAIWFLSWLVHGLGEAGLRAAGRTWRLLPLIPLYLLLRRMNGLESAWWNGLIAGSVIAGIYALWFVLTGQTGDYEFRVEGTTNPMYFGAIALAFAMMLVPRVIDERQHSAIRALALLAIVLAFTANTLSGSRGAWLAVPVLIVIYLFTLGALQRPAWRYGTPAVLLLLSLVVFTWPLLPMHGRVGETLTELNLLGQGLNSDGPLGLRLQMWSIAWSQFLESPWIGSGPGTFREALEQSVAAGIHDPALLRYRHPHNEYLSAMVNAGVVGLVAFAAMIISIAAIYLRRLRASAQTIRFLAWCGIAAISVLSVMALSESIFERNAGILWFALLTTTLAALLKSALRGDESDRF